MKLFHDLTRTDYGLMSLTVLLAVLVMAAFFVRLFISKMRQDGEAAARKAAPDSESPATRPMVRR